MKTPERNQPRRLVFERRPPTRVTLPKTPPGNARPNGRDAPTAHDPEARHIKCPNEPDAADPQGVSAAGEQAPATVCSVVNQQFDQKTDEQDECLDEHHDGAGLADADDRQTDTPVEQDGRSGEVVRPADTSSTAVEPEPEPSQTADGAYRGPAEITDNSPAPIQVPGDGGGAVSHEGGEDHHPQAAAAHAPAPGAEELEAAIRACDDATGGQGLFDSAWESKVATVLMPGLRLLQMVKARGDAALQAIIEHPNFPERKRAPKRGNPGRIVVSFVAKPRTESQRKLCSDWAHLLNAAIQEGIAVEAFTAWALDKGLKACKAEAREKRRSAKVEAATHARTGEGTEHPPAAEAGRSVTGETSSASPECSLEIKVSRGGEAASPTWPLSADECKRIFELVQGFTPDSNKAMALRLIADGIDKP